MMNNNFNEKFYLRDFQINGSHLIEASAGTGKTYNIQNIYARLIMEKGLSVSQIQVMTYTDAATKELHDRLHAILQDVYARLCGKDCLEEDKGKQEKRNMRADQLINCIPEEARSKAKNSVEMALLEFDQSAISTIHGFCERVLSRYAFDSGINFAPEIEDNKSAELNALAEDWWRKHRNDAPSDMKLSTLKTYVKSLARKSDYKLRLKTQDTSEQLDTGDYTLKTAQELVEEYEAARPESQTMTFDDLLHALRNALKKDNPRSGQLIFKLREEFKAALIDEFQDTDPVQYEIFERIFLDGNPNPLFFVGDPKQAIYAFRGGDIFTYLKAKNNTSLHKYTLNENHRSTKRIMDAVNCMFLDHEGLSIFEHNQINYPFPGAIVENEPNVKGPILDHPFQIIGFTPKEKNSPSFSSDMPQILELMTKRILDILNEKDKQGKPVFLPGDIAILTNSNERNLEIHKRLMKSHIPSVVRKSGNVFSSPVAKEFWLFLLAVVNPMKKKVVPCAVTTVFCENPPSKISDLEKPEILAEYVKKFSSLNHEWKSHGLTALIAGLEAGGYRKRLAVRPDGARHLADINQILEMFFAAAKQLRNAPEKLTGWLAERINEAPSDSNKFYKEKDPKEEKYLRELETDEDAVKIMTIHASKGLAARIVFLPDAWNISGKQFEPFSYHEAEDVCFGISENAKEQNKLEQDQEKIRLLYVAMTRAIERMILFAPPVKTIQDEPLYKLLNNLKARGGENPPYEVIPVSSTPGNEEYELPVQNTYKEAKTPPEIKTTYFKKSFSSLFGKKDKDDDNRDVDSMTGKNVAVSDDAGHPIFQIPGGAAIGTCWHNILEKVPFDAEEKKIREIAEEELTVNGFMEKESIPDATTDMILKTLHYEFKSPGGDIFTLSDVPWPDRLSEQEFNVSYNNLDISKLKNILQEYWKDDTSKEKFLKMLTMDDKAFPEGFLNGFIDLIFRHGEYFYVIDWKSNSIGGKRENFKESGVCAEMAKHLYFFQYLLYSVILHSYLKQTLGSRYSWEKNFGGIRYCFLRGIAAGGEAPVFEDRPTEKMLDELEIAFGLTGKE